MSKFVDEEGAKALVKMLHDAVAESKTSALPEHLAGTVQDLMNKITNIHATCKLSATPSVIEKGVDTSVTLSVTEAKVDQQSANKVSIYAGADTSANKLSLKEGVNIQSLSTTQAVKDDTTFSCRAYFPNAIFKKDEKSVKAYNPIFVLAGTADAPSGEDIKRTEHTKFRNQAVGESASEYEVDKANHEAGEIVAKKMSIRSTATGNDFGVTVTPKFRYVWFCVPSDIAVPKKIAVPALPDTGLTQNDAVEVNVEVASGTVAYKCIRLYEMYDPAKQANYKFVLK